MYFLGIFLYILCIDCSISCISKDVMMTMMMLAYWPSRLKELVTKLYKAYARNEPCVTDEQMVIPSLNLTLLSNVKRFQRINAIFILQEESIAYLVSH